MVNRFTFNYKETKLILYIFSLHFNNTKQNIVFSLTLTQKTTVIPLILLPQYQFAN